MLVSFKFGNYRSFKDDVNFNMMATILTSRSKLNMIFDASKNLKLLNCAAIYGANSSGKSNFIKAFEYMRNMVLYSSGPFETEISDQRFRSIDLAPYSQFEMSFVINEIEYTYGFRLENNKIYHEHLYAKESQRPKLLFLRNGSEFKFGNNLKNFSKLEKVNGGGLFLPFLRHLSPHVTSIIDWFYEIKIPSEIFNFQDLSKNINSRDYARNLAKVIDPNIDEFEIIGGEFCVRKHGILFPITSEPESLRRILAFADSLYSGKLVIIDELDKTFHTLVFRKIVEDFIKYNPGNAQLIFTANDTSLLKTEFFRRDQIWFTEKNEKGESRIFPLRYFKIRNDASFGKNYLNGEFGAIPKILLRSF